MQTSPCKLTDCICFFTLYGEPDVKTLSALHTFLICLTCVHYERHADHYKRCTSAPDVSGVSDVQTPPT